MEDGYRVFNVYDDSPLVMPETLMSGHHEVNGILIASGPGVREGMSLERANLTDVLPTILHALDLPIDPGIDGEPLVGLFTSAFRQQHVVRYSEPSCAGGEHGLGDALTPEEEAQIRSRLQSLGYLG
jgi:hypothetical protein